MGFRPEISMIWFAVACGLLALYYALPTSFFFGIDFAKSSPTTVAWAGLAVLALFGFCAVMMWDSIGM